MKFSTTLALLASLAASVAANGSIVTCTGSNGANCQTTGGYVPPNNCNGGCVNFGFKSGKEGSVDSGYCFTAYTSTNCNSGKKLLNTGGYTNGNFKSFSYDCC
ncbi:hypothetical protein EJ04DRAFT_527566 [Polyplosphaeria fusca]|uniref:Uncharacterized protein n=1 Tax=Polyplosphaeria fusca TaxID=682080 RepID=A0A9P4QNN7_9PLEO|nr:hypothetical protein EJ04DRAFT_527566 [Polyplosphaeria fusca]